MNDDNDDLRLVAAFREDLDEETSTRLASVRAEFLKGRNMNARKTIFTPRRIAVVALPAVAAIALGAVALGSIGGGGTTPNPPVAAESPATLVLTDSSDARAVLAYASHNTGAYYATVKAEEGNYIYEYSTATIDGEPMPDSGLREAWYDISHGTMIVRLSEDGDLIIPDADNSHEDIEKALKEAEETLKKQGPTLHSPTREFLASLPTDAQAMFELLKATDADQAEDKDWTRFETASATLTRGAAILPAEQRSALLEALGMLEGVTRSEGTITIDGREGVGIGFTQSFGGRTDIVIDPETSEVLGTQLTYVDGRKVIIDTKTKVVAESGDTK